MKIYDSLFCNSKANTSNEYIELFADFVYANYSGGMIFLPELATEQVCDFEITCEQLKVECAERNGSNFSARVYLLNTAGDMIEPHNNQAIYKKISCYISAGATARQKLIKWLPVHIESGFNPHLSDSQISWPVHRDEMLRQLGLAYEGEYNLDIAVKIYLELLISNPDNPKFFYNPIRTLNRMGRFADSLRILQAKKQSKLYHLDYYIGQWGHREEINVYKDAVDKLLRETEDKIKKRYVYKPRKQDYKAIRTSHFDT